MFTHAGTRITIHYKDSTSYCRSIDVCRFSPHLDDCCFCTRIVTCTDLRTHGPSFATQRASGPSRRPAGHRRTNICLRAYPATTDCTVAPLMRVPRALARSYGVFTRYHRSSYAGAPRFTHNALWHCHLFATRMLCWRLGRPRPPPAAPTTAIAIYRATGGCVVLSLPLVDLLNTFLRYLYDRLQRTLLMRERTDSTPDCACAQSDISANRHHRVFSGHTYAHAY